MRRMKRAAGLAALVLLLVLVAPRLAMAHGSEHHGAAPASSEPPASALHTVRNAPAVGAPSCPGDHGGFCTCGSALACPGAKPGVVVAPSVALPFVLAPNSVATAEEVLPRGPPPAFSLRFTRAPPALF
jgi:hypothetical protein